MTPTDPSFAQLLDSLTDGIIWLEPISGQPAQPITDFRVVYRNESARLACAYSLDPAGWLLRDNPLHRAELLPLFSSCARVSETGTPAESPVNTDADQWVTIRQVKSGNAVVLTLRPDELLHPVTPEPEPPAASLKNILNASYNGIAAYQSLRDEAGVITDFGLSECNEVARLLLLPPDGAGQTLLTQASGVRLAAFFPALVRVVETGEPLRLETPYDHHGLSDWFAISVVRLADGFVVTFVDITESRLTLASVTETKRAEALVQRQAELLNNILDNTSYGIIACAAHRDPAGRVTNLIVQTANRVAEAIMSGTGDTLQNKSLAAIDLPCSGTDLLVLCRRAADTGRAQQREFSTGPTGSERWFAVSAAPLNDGFVITLMEVTQTKRMVLALEAQTVMLGDVVNGAINGIVLLEAIREPTAGPAHQTPPLPAGPVIDFYIRAANQATQAMTGVAPEQLVGNRLMDMFSSKKEAGFLDAYVKALDTGVAQRLEAYYPADTRGLEGWFDASAVKQGENGIVLTFFNTTEAKKAELGRQALIAELQRSNANLEQFAYVASHDLQEPLRKVMAFGDVLQQQFAPALGDTGADLVQRMQSAAGRMQLLIKDLLTYSRVATKREPFRPIDINRIVADVLIDLETVIIEKAATIHVDSLPKMPGDGLQIRQLFQNLLSNALKFSRPGVVPAIAIDCQPVPGSAFAVVPATESRRKFYLIDVADNGIGFEPKYAERIFQVFQRLHGRNQYAGTGIGLAIVQKVVENHGGYIWAVSRPGEGTTFKILLPSHVSY